MPRWASLAAEDGVMELAMPKSAAYRLSDDEKENNNGGALMHSNGVESPSNGFKYSDCEDSIGKESGGRSGRRKQSKPARVFLDMEGGGAEGEAAAPPASAALASKEKTEVDMETEFSCDLCNDSFSSQNELTEHIQVTHALHSSESAQTNMELFPTKYHRLGSELQQEVVFPTPVETKVDLSQSERESRPNSNSSESQNGSTGSKARIFHQDAYCKLCDREFCNKYFLKIHMANKHGVFEEGASPGSINGTDLPPTKPVLSESPPALITQPTPPKPALISIPSTPPKPTSTAKGSTKKDMEDYCEICQKHFCNKYYLRKHKNDVHGIAPDVASSSSKKGRPTNTASSSANSSSSSSNISSPSSAPLASSNSLASVITTSCTNPLLMPPLSTTASSLPSMSGASSMPGLNSMANVMFINPFAPPVAILQAQPVLQSGSPAFPPPPHLGSMPSMPPVPISSSSAPESPKATPAPSASPSSRNEISAGDAMRNLSKGSSRSNDSLRSMGILNADAYCEICRKEFCNKYFLGIHKANKHGIYTDEALNPLLLPGLTPGMPENLSMRSVGDLGDKEKMDLSKIKTEGVPTSEEVCEICKKEFNNKFSLKIHLVNAHNIKPQDFDLGLELFKQDKINGNQAVNAGASMFGNMMAAKMADRVTCDICNKEVCNKYFLKTHKIKVHGIDPIEAEKELEAKTTPTKPGTPATGNASSPAETAKEALQRPNDEELLKMGIDPEAYCEICRKEFCSKYFLKTHKANIHGIKADNTPSVPAMPALPIPSLKFHDQSLLRPQLPFGLPQSGASMVPLPGALPLLDPHSSPENEAAKSENKWMWKEPSNQTRVMCEICNKELCNKYFLKTHLMKKHGITYDISTGQMMPKEKENPPTSTPQAPLPTSHEKESPKGDTAPDSMDSTNTVVSAKTWSIPSQLPMPDKIKMDHTDLGPRQICAVCGISFGEKVTLQFHLIKDHGAEVTIPSTKEEPGSEDAKDQVKRAKIERSMDSPQKAGSLPVDHEASPEKRARKKKFRCVHCQQRFNSRAKCKSHIRASHASNLKPKQAFNIQGSEHLFPSDCKVQLPVLQNIREPITVTLFPANV